MWEEITSFLWQTMSSSCPQQAWVIHLSLNSTLICKCELTPSLLPSKMERAEHFTGILNFWERPCLPIHTSKDINSWTLVPIPAGKQSPRTSCAAASCLWGCCSLLQSSLTQSALHNTLKFLLVSLLNPHSSVRWEGHPATLPLIPLTNTHPAHAAPSAAAWDSPCF